MLSIPARLDKVARHHASLIYTQRPGDLVVDSLALPPGTFTEVLGLGILFVSFLAGVLTLGTLM